jgi:hypothetical protein
MLTSRAKLFIFNDLQPSNPLSNVAISMIFCRCMRRRVSDVPVTSGCWSMTGDLMPGWPAKLDEVAFVDLGWAVLLAV